jgi:hypothetical protein
MLVSSSGRKHYSHHRRGRPCNSLTSPLSPSCHPNLACHHLLLLDPTVVYGVLDLTFPGPTPANRLSFRHLPYVTKSLRLSITSLSAAPLRGNFGFIFFHKLVCKLFRLSLHIHPFLIGGRRPARTEMESCCRDSTPLPFLGLGRYGLNKTSVFLMESFLIWHEHLPWPARRGSYGRLQGLEEFHF